MPSFLCRGRAFDDQYRVWVSWSLGVGCLPMCNGNIDCSLWAPKPQLGSRMDSIPCCAAAHTPQHHLPPTPPNYVMLKSPSGRKERPQAARTSFSRGTYNHQTPSSSAWACRYLIHNRTHQRDLVDPMHNAQRSPVTDLFIRCRCRTTDPPHRAQNVRGVPRKRGPLSGSALKPYTSRRFTIGMLPLVRKATWTD